MAKEPTLREWLQHNLERAGATHKIDHEYYARFLKVTDKEMRQLIRAVIYAHADEINRMAFDKTGRYKDEDFLKLIQNSLSLLFEGWLCFSDKGLGLVKPEGPPPTENIKRLLAKRVEESVPLIRRTFIEVMNRSNDRKRKN